MSKPDPNLSSKASPVKLGSTGVRKANNLPVYILGGVVGVFVLAIAMVAYDRAHPRQAEEKPADKSDSLSLARQMAGDRLNGLIDPPKPPTPPPTMPGQSKPDIEVPIARPGAGVDMSRPPQPPSQSKGPSQYENDLQRVHARKIQEIEAALSAKTNVAVTDFRNRSAMGPAEAKTADNGQANPATSVQDTQLQKLEEVRKQIETLRTQDPNAAYRERLAQLQSAGLGGMPMASNGIAPSLMLANSGQASQAQKPNNDIGQFAGTGQVDRWRLNGQNAQVQAPRTPYELRAGFVIPATMISGINSDLPGQIMAQVSQNVYDTPTGKYLLVPQGARLVGSYSHEVAYGQKRVLVAWQRIVFPDGKAMDVGAMPGADGAGYGGFNDLVDNHYLRIFGSALLMSVVIAGVNYSQSSINGNNNGTTATTGQQQTATGALSQAMGQQLGIAISQMVSKNLNIAPTLEIRPGFRFNVMVIKDMTFTKPYQSFDY